MKLRIRLIVVAALLIFLTATVQPKGSEQTDVGITAVSLSSSSILDENFQDVLLDSEWIVDPGRGGFSLTDNPGYLRYIIDAYHTSFWGGEGYDKSLHLIRSFSGDQWILTTTITYNMRPEDATNNRNMHFWVTTLNYSKKICIDRSVGVYDDNPGSNCLSLTGSPRIYFPNSPDPLPLERWYFEIKRDKDSFLIKASNDGDDSTFEYQSEHSFSPDSFGSDQQVVISGDGWYGSPGGWADFDFIRVIASDASDWWSMFHHDPKHTGYSTSSAPNYPNTVWWYWLAGQGFSSPCVADGMVFIGSSNIVYALNETNGLLIWDYVTDGPVHNSVPAVADGKVFIGSWDNKVYALNETDGSVIWNFTSQGQVNGSPTVVDGRVFIGSDDENVYALNETTGSLLWNFATGGSVQKSAAVADGQVFIGSSDHYLYALNETTGSLIWSHYFTVGDGATYSPAVADGKVFVSLWSGSVYALDEKNGSEVWSFLNDDMVIPGSSPALALGKVFVGGTDGRVYAFNQTNGQVIWRYLTGREIASSPAVADGKVFIGSRDEHFYALDAENGALIWRYDTNDTVISSPAVANGKVFVASFDGTLFAFGRFVGDLNNDGKVDILDISFVAMSFGAQPGDGNWNGAADLNDDKIVNIVDMATVALQFGKAY